METIWTQLNYLSFKMCLKVYFLRISISECQNVLKNSFLSCSKSKPASKAKKDHHWKIQSFFNYKTNSIFGKEYKSKVQFPSKSNKQIVLLNWNKLFLLYAIFACMFICVFVGINETCSTMNKLTDQTLLTYSDVLHY